MGERIDFPDVREGDRWPPDAGAPAPRPVLQFINAANFAGKAITPREWHVEGLIPARNVTMLSGDGATGKTLLALQLAAATVTGTSWIGQLPAKGRTVFVTAEDDMDELHRRMADVCRGQGLRMQDLGGLDLLSLAGMDALLASPEGRSDLLRSTPLFASLEEAVLERRPALLIIDPLADVFGGDEIRKTQARQFIALLRGLSIRADTSTLLLSHPSQAGMSSGEGTSGNVGWSNSVRSRMYFERPRRDRDDDAVVDPDTRVLSLKKSNYGPPSMTINLKWSGGVFALQGGSSSFGFSPQDADARFLDLLATFDREGRNVTSVPCSTFAPKLFAQHPDARGIKKADFQSAMNRLFGDGKIKLLTEGSPARQRSRIVAAT
ncbi:MAG: RecA-family ATPase [Hyphomicrobiales bacterium]|nr:RecA-family ATPase [Hyphomicrobiales bacterium]